MNRTKKYIAALYCRLSKDDGSTNESMSIYSQKAMLKQYAEQNDIAIYDYYVDDGYSGTNFERPAFKKMITDIEKEQEDIMLGRIYSRIIEMCLPLRVTGLDRRKIQSKEKLKKAQNLIDE